MTNTLIAHRGAFMATEEEVCEVVDPERTETWAPVPHRTFIELLSDATKSAGLVVEDKQYALSRRVPRVDSFGNKIENATPVIGERMFGLWELDRVDNGHRWAIGFRGSHDKSMSIGIAAGTRVFNCDNLSLSGDYVSIRKQTSGLDYPELVQMTRGAIVKVVRKLDEFSKWIRALNVIPVSTEDAMMFFVDGLDHNLFPSSRFKKLLGCWKEERKTADAPTLGNVYNSFTRLVREDDLFRIADTTAKLEALMDENIIMRRGA